jgi:hypothetical protein
VRAELAKPVVLNRDRSTETELERLERRRRRSELERLLVRQLRQVLKLDIPVQRLVPDGKEQREASDLLDRE